MPIVSIIIPVYNTSQFLSRSIESVLNQSFGDFELILVDDGSTDGSGEICESYARRDCRVNVLHQKNGGVSSARNSGLDYAKGDWIFFVDSDDEVLPDGLQVLVNLISNDVDLVMGGFVEVELDDKTIEINTRTELYLPKKQSVLSLYMGYGSCYPFCGYLWMRLLRRAIIQEHHLLFDTSIAIKEDSLFLMQYICRSNGITHQTTTPVYKYRRRLDSAMGKALSEWDPKYVDSFYALVKMKHEMDTVFSSCSSPLFVAKQAIYGRYYSIVEKMNANNVHNDELKKELYSIMSEEMGSVFLFKIRRKLRKVFKITS